MVVNESPEPEPEIVDAPAQRSVPNENEVERIPSALKEENGIEREGPFAEALIQNEQMFHHLKILKPSPSEMENQRRKSLAEVEQLEKPRKGVYSQVCYQLGSHFFFLLKKPTINELNENWYFFCTFAEITSFFK